MCLITKQTVPFIAKKDITVYKLFRTGSLPLVTYNMEFVYDLNVVYQTVIYESNQLYFFDATAQTALELLDKAWDRNSEFKCYGRGFHSAKTKERFEKSRNSHTAVYECTIPKVSQYFEDTSGLLVSNQIIINKRVL